MNTTNLLTVEKYQEQADKIISLINSGEDVDAYIILSQNTHLIKGEDPYISDLYIKSLYQNLVLDGYKERAKSLISVLKKNNPSLLKLVKSGASMEVVRKTQCNSLEDIQTEAESEISRDPQEELQEIFEGG